MFDVEIRLRSLSRDRGWVVDVRSIEPSAFAEVNPIRDSDLEMLDLPKFAKTWKGFLATLSPGGNFVPDTAMLRSVGSIIMERILGSREILKHLAGVDLRAEREKRPVRLLIEVDENDPVLACLPIELAFDGSRFYFKSEVRPAFRVAPYSEARNLQLGRNARVLIATAHSDQREPDKSSLDAHAATISASLAQFGFKPDHLPDATLDGLRQALLEGEIVDLLYVVCHGIEDPSRAGQLILRDGSLFGEELARWLEVAVERKRAIQAVILCACSSAFPRVEEGTLGMAQWLVRPGRALAALGFRGPVKVQWAMKWSERLFAALGAGNSLEEAFAKARYAELEGETQWILPVLYARRRDPDAEYEEGVQNTGSGPDDLGNGRNFPFLQSPPLPRRPRSYFTGRSRDRQVLENWARSPGAAQITAVQGWGGIGKSELATVLAHDQRKAGRLVVWLDRPDKDILGAQTTLLSVADFGFRPSPISRSEDLIKRIRQRLGPYPGLLILDDITEPAVVDLLLPSGEWNVLITTRVQGLLPGAFEVKLDPLEKEDALLLLSRIAWNTEGPPAVERTAAEILVERLGRLPLAIELAGGTLRDMISAEEYLTSLDLDEGVASSDQAKVEASLIRTLADLDKFDELCFKALGILSSAGAPPEAVATTVGESQPKVTRCLDRLVRYSLAMWSPDTRRYVLHPFLRRAAKNRARQEPEVWDKLNVGAVGAISELVQWVLEPNDKEMLRDRWRRHRDFFESIDPSEWGKKERSKIQAALRLLSESRSASRAEANIEKKEGSDFSGDRQEFNKDRYLEGLGPPIQDSKIAGDRGLGSELVRIGPSEEAQPKAARLKQEGDSLLKRGLFEDADSRYDEALGIYQLERDRHGQATVLRARGELQLLRSDFDGAAQDFDQALALFGALDDAMGQAAVLLSRGNLRRLRREVLNAGQDYDRALILYRKVKSELGNADVLKAKGDLEKELARFASAILFYNQALEIYRIARAWPGVGGVLKALGDISRERSDFDVASTNYREAVAVYEKIGDQLGLANTYQAQGDLERIRVRLEDARKSYTRALEIYRELRDPFNTGNVLAELARVSGLEGNAAEARLLAAEAIRISISSENEYARSLAMNVQEAFDINS